MIHPDDASGSPKRNTTLRDGEPLDVEHRSTAKERAVRWLRDQATIVRDEDGRPRFSHGFLIDVGERKSRRASDGTMRAPISFADRDAAVGDVHRHARRDSVPVYVSPQVATIFGYTPDEWRSMMGLAELSAPR